MVEGEGQRCGQSPSEGHCEQKLQQSQCDRVSVVFFEEACLFHASWVSGVLFPKMIFCRVLLEMEHLNLWVRTGTKDLKRSQEYPRSFGQRVAECHLKYMSSASWLAKRKLNNWHSPGQRSWSICSLRKWLPVGIAGFVANLHRFPCPFGLCTLSRFEADRMAILGGAVVRSYKYKPLFLWKARSVEIKTSFPIDDHHCLDDFWCPPV